jgi:hypothetical protein
MVILGEYLRTAVQTFHPGRNEVCIAIATSVFYDTLATVSQVLEFADIGPSPQSGTRIAAGWGGLELGPNACSTAPLVLKFGPVSRTDDYRACIPPAAAW